jgi:hypothetical protein
MALLARADPNHTITATIELWFLMGSPGGLCPALGDPISDKHCAY